MPNSSVSTSGSTVCPMCTGSGLSPDGHRTCPCREPDDVPTSVRRTRDERRALLKDTYVIGHGLALSGNVAAAFVPAAMTVAAWTSGPSWLVWIAFPLAVVLLLRAIGRAS